MGKHIGGKTSRGNAAHTLAMANWRYQLKTKTIELNRWIAIALGELDVEVKRSSKALTEEQQKYYREVVAPERVEQLRDEVARLRLSRPAVAGSLSLSPEAIDSLLASSKAAQHNDLADRMIGEGPL